MFIAGNLQSFCYLVFVVLTKNSDSFTVLFCLSLCPSAFFERYTKNPLCNLKKFLTKTGIFVIMSGINLRTSLKNF